MYPMRADKPYQTIATDDIGAFAVLALERPKDSIDLELEIAGSELTNPRAAVVFREVSVDSYVRIRLQSSRGRRVTRPGR